MPTVADVFEDLRDNVGCWFDGCAGFDTNALRVIQLAEEFGMRLSDADQRAVSAYMDWHATESDVDTFHDIHDEAVTFLENLEGMPDGLSFGYHDGDFVLQSSEWWSEDV